MDELQTIMQSLLPILDDKLQYASSVFNLWFSDLALVELTEDRAVFETSTRLKQKILGTKYKKDIEECLEEIIGFSVNAEFINRENNSPFNEAAPAPVPAFTKDTEEHTEEKREDPAAKENLLDSYTFENFIEGASNKFARAACFAVAKEPTTYNPLFIWGQSGLGKTHLLYAVINYIKKNNPEMKIVYKKSEEFINELIGAISSGTTAAFKEKYRTADVLLIDDIQFLAGKESTQEEFFHTFTALYEAEKQIILTSDRPPKEIKPLEDRLRTRFEGGLLADVQPPSFELRTAIIRKKADMKNLDIPPDIVDYMAERLQNNIRQIEGVIQKMSAFVKLSERPINRGMVEEVISVIDPGNVPTAVLVDRILMVVCQKFGVSVDDIKSKKKTDNIARARHIAAYIIRKVTPLPLKAIGEIFGRDHSTILASISKVDINIKTVKNEEALIEDLIKTIKSM